MNQVEVSFGKAQAEAGQESQSLTSQPTAPQSYRSPQIFAIGSAVELLQRDGTGHLRDGTGGWWVWGS